MRSHSLRGALLASLIAALTACSGDSTGPKGNPTEQLANTDFEQHLGEMQLVFDQPVMRALGESSSGMLRVVGNDAPRPMLRRLGLATVSTTDARSAAVAHVGARLLASARMSAGVAPGDPMRIPEAAFGTTFERVNGLGEVDPNGTYEATSRAGAPATGVRFIVYELDEMGDFTGQEAGYVDFIDVSTATEDRIRTMIVQTLGTTRTVMDFTTALAVSGSSMSYNLTGSATDGARTLLFGDTLLLANLETETPQMRFRFGARLQGADVAVGGDVNLASSGAGIEATLWSRVNGVTLRYTTAVTASGATLSVFVNDALYATITWTQDSADEPVWRHADGSPLSADELTRLEALEETSFELTELFLLSLDASTWVYDVQEMSAAP
jgi:hypothetical protein